MASCVVQWLEELPPLSANREISHLSHAHFHPCSIQSFFCLKLQFSRNFSGQEPKGFLGAHFQRERDLGTFRSQSLGEDAYDFSGGAS